MGGFVSRVGEQDMNDSAILMRLNQLEGRLAQMENEGDYSSNVAGEPEEDLYTPHFKLRTIDYSTVRLFGGRAIVSRVGVAPAVLPLAGLSGTAGDTTDYVDITVTQTCFVVLTLDSGIYPTTFTFSYSDTTYPSTETAPEVKIVIGKITWNVGGYIEDIEQYISGDIRYVVPVGDNNTDPFGGTRSVTWDGTGKSFQLYQFADAGTMDGMIPYVFHATGNKYLAWMSRGSPAPADCGNGAAGAGSNGIAFADHWHHVDGSGLSVDHAETADSITIGGGGTSSLIHHQLLELDHDDHPQYLLRSEGSNTGDTPVYFLNVLGQQVGPYYVVEGQIRDSL